MGSASAAAHGCRRHAAAGRQAAACRPSAWHARRVPALPCPRKCAACSKPARRNPAAGCGHQPPASGCTAGDAPAGAGSAGDRPVGDGWPAAARRRRRSSGAVADRQLHGRRAGGAGAGHTACGWAATAGRAWLAADAGPARYKSCCKQRRPETAGPAMKDGACYFACHRTQAPAAAIQHAEPCECSHGRLPAASKWQFRSNHDSCPGMRQVRCC